MAVSRKRHCARWRKARSSTPARDQQVANCCRQLVRRPRDLGLATQSLHDTAELFATMVDAALQRAERRHPLALESVVAAGGGIGRVA